MTACPASLRQPRCTAARRLTAAVTAGLGVALLSDRYLRPEMVVITDRLPAPPALAYVIRRARKARNPALYSLIGAVIAEVTRNGGLSLAA